MTRRRLILGMAAVTAAVAVPLLVLSGGGVGLTGVARAATKTQDAGSAKFVVNVQAGGVAGQSVLLTGAIDFSVPRATMTFSAGDGQLSGQMILDGNVWYVKLPAPAGLDLPSGKQWLKLDATEAGNAQQSLAMLKLFDPARLFGLLENAGTFSAAGHETVAGVDTTHYSGSVDVARFAAALGRPQSAPGNSPKAFAVDAWVDGQGYLRRLVFAIPAIADSPAATVTVDFSDFGTAVDATPPPADQVEDFTALAKGGFGGTGTGSGHAVVLTLGRAK